MDFGNLNAPYSSVKGLPTRPMRLNLDEQISGENDPKSGITLRSILKSQPHRLKTSPSSPGHHRKSSRLSQ